MIPTHYHTHLGRLRLITIHGDVTSDGIHTNSIDQIFPVTDLIGTEVTKGTCSGVIERVLSDKNNHVNGRYIGNRYATGYTFWNSLVGVRWFQGVDYYWQDVNKLSYAHYLINRD